MRASKIFYLVSKIISIITIVATAIIMGIFIGYCVYLLGSGKLPFTPEGQKQQLTTEGVTAALIMFIISTIIIIGTTIANLVLSIKAPGSKDRGIHIASIVMGVISGVAFSVPAGIIALCNLNKEETQNIQETK